MDDQNKRLLLAIVISFVFIFVYQSYFMPAPPAPVEEAQPGAAQPAPAGTIESVRVLSPEEIQAAVEPLAAAEERLLTVDTPLYRAVVTNRGGALKSLQLKRYRQEIKDPDSWVELVRLAPEDSSLPLSAEFTAAGGPLGFSTALFVSEDKDLSLDLGESGVLTFRRRTPEGLEMVRTLRFSGDNYATGVSIRLVNRGSETIGGRVGLNWTTGLELPTGAKPDKLFSTSKYGYSGAIYLDGGKTRKVKGDKLEGTLVLEQAPTWIASEDMYFVAALLPIGGVTGGLARTSPDGRVEVGLFSQASLAPGTATELSATSYMGPKDMGILKSVDPSLEGTIELGWFGFIARPMLFLLSYFYGYVKNWGVAIIILTILIKIVFIPFSTISHRSMKKMQTLQPQINALRDRYKKDRDKLNQEIMVLYRENKVNPASGCLPILVQIPVFFALYRALLGAIELRHAPLALWITDLSAKDPYYITPIIMGATMVLQQKMTPTSADPRQAQIMMFMPVVFTAMFLNFPSGLVVYWLVNNVLTIGHQYFLNKGTEQGAPAAVEVQAGKKKGKRA